MARTAKTNHVMSLVGEKSKNDSADKAVPKQKNCQKPSAKLFNPAIPHMPHMEEEHGSAHYNESLAASPPVRKNTETEKSGDLKKASLPKKPDSNSDSIKEKSDPEEEIKTSQPDQSLTQKYSHRSDGIGKPEEDFQGIKNREKCVKQGITAVVPDLVNQELEAIVERFNIKPTDSNLWQITKSVLETVRPEFSLNACEYAEKCSKLRQRVILEMTKAAIKISKGSKNK